MGNHVAKTDMCRMTLRWAEGGLAALARQGLALRARRRQHSGQGYTLLRRSGLRRSHPLGTYIDRFIARAHAWCLQVLVSDSLVLHVLSLRSVRTLLGWRQRGRSRLLLEPTDTRRDPCHVWRVTSDALAGGQHALLICVYTCSSLAVAQAGHFGQIRSALLVLPLRGGALRRDLR